MLEHIYANLQFPPQAMLHTVQWKMENIWVGKWRQWINIHLNKEINYYKESNHFKQRLNKYDATQVTEKGEKKN